MNRIVSRARGDSSRPELPYTPPISTTYDSRTRIAADAAAASRLTTSCGILPRAHAHGYVLPPLRGYLCTPKSE